MSLKNLVSDQLCCGRFGERVTCYHFRSSLRSLRFRCLDRKRHCAQASTVVRFLSHLVRLRVSSWPESREVLISRSMQCLICFVPVCPTTRRSHQRGCSVSARPRLTHRQRHASYKEKNMRPWAWPENHGRKPRVSISIWIYANSWNN